MKIEVKKKLANTKAIKTKCTIKKRACRSCKQNHSHKNSEKEREETDLLPRRQSRQSEEEKLEE